MYFRLLKICRRYRNHFLLQALIIVVMCACSGDGVHSSSSFSVEDTYLLLVSDNRLVAIDPNKPDQEIFITDTYTGLFVVPHTTDPASKPKINFQFAYYIDAGAIYRLDLRKSSLKGLKPVQVSNRLSGEYCSVNSYRQDWLERVRSDVLPLSVMLPASGTKCSPPFIYQYINLELNSNTLQHFDSISQGPTNRRAEFSGNNAFTIFRTDVAPELVWSLYVSNNNQLLLDAPNSAASIILLDNVTSLEFLDSDNGSDINNSYFFLKIDNNLYTYNVIEGLNDLHLQVLDNPKPSYLPDSYPDREQYYFSSGQNHYVLEKLNGSYKAIQLNLDSEPFLSNYREFVGSSDDDIVVVSGDSIDSYTIYSLPRIPGTRIELAKTDAANTPSAILVGENRFLLQSSSYTKLIDSQNNLIKDFTGLFVNKYSFGFEGSYLAVSTEESGSDMKLFSLDSDKYVGDLGTLPSGTVFETMITYRLNDQLLAVNRSIFSGENPLIFNTIDHSYTKILPQNANTYIVNKYFGQPIESLLGYYPFRL